jgi:hypothetical protein
LLRNVKIIRIAKNKRGPAIMRGTSCIRDKI